MKRYVRQVNECCGGFNYLVVQEDKVICGFSPGCFGLMEREPQVLPGLSPDAVEITQAEYYSALHDPGL